MCWNAFLYTYKLVKTEEDNFVLVFSLTSNVPRMAIITRSQHGAGKLDNYIS